MIQSSSSAVITLASIVKEYEKEFIQKHDKQLLPSHLKTLSALKICRSEYSPKMLMECESKKCSNKTLIPHSCGNRHCPHCQNYETGEWIDKQLQKLLPTDYFLITFTLPQEFRKVAWCNQRIVYGLLFNAVWATIKSFCLNDKKLRGTPGAIAVLHTNSRELSYHPHIHILLPAAAINKKEQLWSEKRSKYLFNHKALAKVFRAKMLDAFTKNNINLPPNYPKNWIVNCKSVGKGRKAVIYLSKYLYRGVVSEKNILSCKNGKVTFGYINSTTNKYQTKTVSATYFLWLVLQHVLPRGFRRSRNYGFLHPNSKKLLKILQWMFRLKIEPLNSTEIKPRPKMICKCCGALMKIVKTKLKISRRLVPI
jgi:hypothetical protein